MYRCASKCERELLSCPVACTIKKVLTLERGHETAGSRHGSAGHRLREHEEVVEIDARVAAVASGRGIAIVGRAV